MSVILTGTLIVLGAVATIGIGGGIWHACTEDERARARINQLQAENNQLNLAKNYVSDIKDKLSNAKEYLTSAKNNFKNGGHVLYDEPLANNEFTSCISKLEGAINNATNLINDFSYTISQNNAKIRTERAKLD